MASPAPWPRRCAKDNPLADRTAIVASGVRDLHERQGLDILAAIAACRVTGHPVPADARQVLSRTFGHADFRGLQAAVIAEVLAGRNAMAVLPTGGGKSVCYQIPA